MNPRALMILTLATAACDSRATASGGGETANPKRLSAELESCGSTTHCSAGLRCWDRVCMREARSTLGDFHAARGNRYSAAGDHDAASIAYADALAAYQLEKLAIPPDVDCAYGQSLVRARGNPDNPELAAKVLHRCLLAVPAAVGLRTQALAGLAELEQSGLDPNQIARPELADRYLTRAPSAPPTEKLAVTVTADPMPRGKTWALIPERLSQPDARAALVPCWEKHFAATKAKSLDARLGLEVKYRPSEYDDEPGSYAVLWSAPPPATTGAAADAQACVRAAVEPLIAPLKLRDAFQATVTVSVK
jgi:hypothetical protein